MPAVRALSPVVLVACACFGQSAGSPAFDVASVRPSARAVGKDAGSQVAFGPAGVSGRNVTLKQLIVDPGNPSIASGPPVPVLDRTGLPGIYDIRVDVRPEPGGDAFTLWQRVLQDQLGLKLESRKEPVEGFVIDHAERTPGAN